MLKIGDFSKQAQVSVKTLRYYDERDLLKPAWIDRFTGYRYYALIQLPRLNRIIVLKDLGFSLEQIKRILQDNLPPDELRGMLRLKHAELEKHIQEEQARLDRIEDRLRHIEQEDVFLLDILAQQKEQLIMKPEIVTKPAFNVIGMIYHGKNENNDLPQLWQKLMPRATEIGESRGLPYGVCGELEEDGRFRYLAGYEVTEETAVPDGMEQWKMDEQTYAAFPCSLQTIGETYKYIFETWLPQSEYSHNPVPDFEFYDKDFDPETGEGMYIYMPVQ